MTGKVLALRQPSFAFGRANRTGTFLAERIGNFFAQQEIARRGEIVGRLNASLTGLSGFEVRFSFVDGPDKLKLTGADLQGPLAAQIRGRLLGVLEGTGYSIAARIVSLPDQAGPARLLPETPGAGR